MFDLIVTPITNKFTAIMQLYSKLKSQLRDEYTDTMTFISNGSTDGFSPSSLHTHNQIRYVGSNKKIYENILVNHAITERGDMNDYILFINVNTQVSKDYFDNVREVIEKYPEVDVFLGRVDYKIKKSQEPIKDPRIKKFNALVKSNSGADLKNFPPVRENSLKNDEKATESSIFTYSDEKEEISTKKTEIEIPAQNISADFTSRLEEPSDAQNFQRAESIMSARLEATSLVTKNVSDEKCHAIFSDKICQCGKCVEKDTIKKVNGVANCHTKKFNINLFNISKFYVPNNLLIKKELVYKMGLLEIDSVFNSACENLLYKLKNLQDAYITYDESFPVTHLGKAKKHRSNNRAINNICNFNFIYKDYVTKNVYNVVKTDGLELPYQQIAIRALVIVANSSNVSVIDLVREQISSYDRLIITDLPDNCSKKLQEIIAKNVESWDCVIIVNPNAKFQYGHFIDDFKRYAVQMDDFGVLVSNRDFDIREVTVGRAIETDASACFNEWNVFSPVLKRAGSLSKFFQRCSGIIDKMGRGLVKEYLPKGIAKDAVLTEELGEGGETIKYKKKGKVHDSSWYNWME